MVASEANVHRLSIEDVYRMVEVGVLRDEDRVELLDGVLVDMTPPSAGHSAAVAWLNRKLVAAAGELEVRVQDLLRIEGGFVLPDLMVIKPLSRVEHPATAELVVEIAVTTQRHDAWKADRYASAGVGEYWIVDLRARTLRSHRRPRADGYEEVADHRAPARVEAVFGAIVDLGELLASGQG